jgi:hypothetical protein
MYSTHITEIDVPYLPQSSCHCHIIAGLSAFLLLSIDQLCDDDCAALYFTDIVSIRYKHIVTLQGPQALATKLWHLDLSNQSPSNGSSPLTMTLLLPSKSQKREVARSILHINKQITTAAIPQLYTCLTAIGSANLQVMVVLSHASLFSPPLSTLSWY